MATSGSTTGYEFDSLEPTNEELIWKEIDSTQHGSPKGYCPYSPFLTKRFDVNLAESHEDLTALQPYIDNAQNIPVQEQPIVAENTIKIMENEKEQFCDILPLPESAPQPQKKLKRERPLFNDKELILQEIARLQNQQTEIRTNRDPNKKELNLASKRTMCAIKSAISRRNKELQKLETQEYLAQVKQENAALRQENAALRQENAAPKQENASLRQENAALRQENASLRQENVVLKQENHKFKYASLKQVVQLSNENRALTNLLANFHNTHQSPSSSMLPQPTILFQS